MGLWKRGNEEVCWFFLKNVFWNGKFLEFFGQENESKSKKGR